MSTLLAQSGERRKAPVKQLVLFCIVDQAAISCVPSFQACVVERGRGQEALSLCQHSERWRCLYQGNSLPKAVRLPWLGKPGSEETHKHSSWDSNLFKKKKKKKLDFRVLENTVTQSVRSLGFGSQSPGL